MKYANTILMVRKIVGEDIRPNGEKVYQTRWEQAQGDIELGSVMKPKNKDIIEFKWMKETPFTGMFR